MLRRADIAALASVMLALTASMAFAHCFLDHSMPASGSVVNAPLSHVALYFDNPFDPNATTVRVLNENGDLVSSGASPSSDDHALTVLLKPIPAGLYFVKWRATSQDGDHTMGAYSFTVKAAP